GERVRLSLYFPIQSPCPSYRSRGAFELLVRIGLGHGGLENNPLHAADEAVAAGDDIHAEVGVVDDAAADDSPPVKPDRAGRARRLVFGTRLRRVGEREAAAPPRTRHQHLPPGKPVQALLGDREADRCRLRSDRSGGQASADDPRPGQEKEGDYACRSPDTEPQHSFNMALSPPRINGVENVGDMNNEACTPETCRPPLS